jgi:hypothetical protein
MERAKQFLIVGLIVAVTAVAAGFGGYTLGKQAGASQATNARAAFFAERGLGGAPGGQAIPGGGAQGFVAGQGRDNFAIGQVKSVDGATIQLSTAQDVLTVVTDDQTKIQKMGAGELSDVTVGERITVQGTRGEDGVMTAQSIQIGGGPPGGMTGGAPPQAPPAGQ